MAMRQITAFVEALPGGPELFRGRICHGHLMAFRFSLESRYRMNAYIAPVMNMRGNQAAMKIQKSGEISSRLVVELNKKKFMPKRVYSMRKQILFGKCDASTDRNEAAW